MKLLKIVNILPLAIIALLSVWGWQQQKREASRFSPVVIGGKASISATDFEDGIAPDPTINYKQFTVVPGSVHDGDTIRVRSQSGEVLKVRFACVDAPELKQQFGIESRNHLRSLLNEAGNKVKLNIVDTDRYGRSVAEVWINKGLVQSIQAGSGHVFAYDKYAKNCPSWEAVKSSEDYAKRLKLGVWKYPNFVRPWDWRRMNKN